MDIFRTAAENAPALMWIRDEHGALVFVNRRYREYLGKGAQEQHREDWRLPIHPDDAEPIGLAIAAATERRETARLDARVIHPTLGIRHLSSEATPQFDEDGDFAGYVGISIDVTEAVQSQEQLRHEQARLRLALDAVNSGDWSWEIGSDRVNLSSLAASLFDIEPGYTPTWEELRRAMVPEDAEHARNAVQAAIAERRDYQAEYRLNRSDGSQILVDARGRPVYDDAGECTGMVGVVRDISKERQTEKTMASLRARQELISEATPECIKIVAEDGRLLHMNPAGLGMIEAEDFDSVAEADTFSLVAPDHQESWRAQHARVLAGERLSWEFDIIGLKGTRRRMETHAVPLRLPNGDVAQLAVTRDITVRKEAEEALQEETRRLETLNRTGAALVSELDIDRLLQMVTDAGVELIGAEFGAFFYTVADARGERFELCSLSGADRNAFGNFGAPRPTAVLEPTFKGEGVVRSGDITADPRYGKNSPFCGMPEGHLPVCSYLAVPVISRSGAVIGGLFYGHSACDMFTESHERLMLGIAGQAGIAIDNARLYQAAQREVVERRRAEEHQKLLINELNHRVKNTLAIVQAIAQQSFKDGGDPQLARRTFEGRLSALSAAHNVLTDQNWELASIRRILDQALAPFGRADAFLIDGPDIALDPKAAVSLALAVHELATNASKYGALSVSEGSVTLRWAADDGRFRLEWVERGGPEVKMPSGRGFGTRMIERALASELEGEVKIVFSPGGVVCSIDAPLPRASHI